MLNQDTKRKIDTARQILVGKVPDPKAQVEQITTALIYKFMDDMDKGAQELGGKSTFFANGYEKYAWTKLMDQKLGGQDRLNLYVEAITTLSQNPHLPQLFRDIFKDAFLPYRDPVTLNLFLKEINGFSYDHSEDLGDAFEYLLLILGSQGEAGQFRTPRHIIDFIVAAVAPKKGETICDPACGTAGFLISAFKFIMNENKENPLTPDERKNLMDHIVGYDISPDMVRLSKVNLYLHGFPNPTISEYDTLSSEEKWDDNFDVILANPPFMSPKGGIIPHKRFSVQANRSEVLFVDYILEHLRPNGRAGIIVPEGIIFQSATAYKTLRKLLLEDGLSVVVSLPAGVFNPYSGVKTSVLLFDSVLSKKTKEILFLKIQNDGFDLGAQRREIDKNNLPLALKIIKKYKNAIKYGEVFKFDENEKHIAHLVSKDKIADSGDYNLIGDRYREAEGFANKKWEMVELGEILNYEQPTNYIVESVNYDNKRKTPVLTAGRTFILGYTNEEKGIYPINKLPVIIFDDFTTAIKFVDFPFKVKSSAMKILKVDNNRANIKYVFRIMLNIKFNADIHKRYWISEYSKIKIPLPPLEVQKEIVEQIEVKQKAIDAAKAVIENLERERRYFGHALRKLEGVGWVKLSEVAEVVAGQSPEGKYYNVTGEGMPFYQGKTEFTNMYLGKSGMWTKKITKIAEQGDILMSVRAPVGPVNIATEEICIGRGLASIRANKIGQIFLFHYLKSIEDKVCGNGGAVFDSISKRQIEELRIPLPPFETQSQLVAEMEEQEKIIEVNKKLITMMEQKIADVLNEI